MRRTPYRLLTLAVLVLLVGPIGTAVFVLGLVFGDSPCVLCWAQRTGMILVALTGLFVVRYGPRPRYVGLGLLVSVAGIYMGIRHSALHLARDVGQGFSVELLGAHTYTWSAFIFWVCAVVMALLVVTARDDELRRTERRLQPLEQLAMWLFLLTVAGNAVQAFASTGPPPYMGQSDPIRFSFQPRHWVWSLEEWSPAPISLRGRWAIAKPDLATLPTNPAAGPLGALPALAVGGQRPLGFALDTAATDLAFDGESRRFLLTTAAGVYLADESLGRAERRAIVDTAFSVDLARFGGAAFLGRDTVLAVSENKSYVVLRESGSADRDRNFRFFLDGFEHFEEQGRGRFTTVRARMMYTLAAAFDRERQSIYTVTVPNARARRLVVSRFDRRDMMLSEEFTPVLSADGGLALAAKERSIDEYYVTGAAVDDGRLYALSAAYSTLLVIDLDTRALVAAYAVPGLERATGLTLRDDAFVAVTPDGTVVEFARPEAGGVDAPRD